MRGAGKSLYPSLFAHLSRMLFVQFVVELDHFGSRLFERTPAACRNPVKPSPAPTACIELRFQQSGTLQAMQQRVKRSRPDAIAMVLQFLHHSQPEDGLLRRMEQHMDSNQSEKEFPSVFRHRIHYTSACLLSNFDI